MTRAIELLAEEIRISMQLMGAETVADLGPQLLGTGHHPDLRRGEAVTDRPY